MERNQTRCSMAIRARLAGPLVLGVAAISSVLTPAYSHIGKDENAEGRHEPVDIVDLSSGVAAIAAGGGHTCALTSIGAVKCWGFNYGGVLGDGTEEHRTTPVDVVGLDSGVTAIAGGGEHACAITKTGSVKCWGGNKLGQLGDGTKENRLTPVDVVGLKGKVSFLAAGVNHTCAVFESGAVQCWGWNHSSQLGDGTKQDRLTPVDVTGLSSGVSSLVAGTRNTCAVTIEGGVKCWGNVGAGGMQGSGPIEESSVPEEKAGLRSVVALAAGDAHDCALTRAGGVKCWGWGSFGSLGIGKDEGSLAPTDVVGLSKGATSIAAGKFHTCAVTSEGGVKCWGHNDDGQVGVEVDGLDEPTPVDVDGLSSGVRAISAGAQHTCALTSKGAVKCWGGFPPLD